MSSTGGYDPCVCMGGDMQERRREEKARGTIKMEEGGGRSGGSHMAKGSELLESHHCISGKASLWYPSSVLRMFDTLPLCKTNSYKSSHTTALVSIPKLALCI